MSRRLDDALERATQLLRIEGVVAIGGDVVAGEEVIQVQLDRLERDLAVAIPAEIEGVAVNVLEDRTFVVRGDRLSSLRRDDVELESAQLAALSERMASGRPSARDYHRMLRVLMEASLADRQLTDWAEIERIARAGVHAFPRDTVLLGHLLVLAVRRGDTLEQETITSRICELDPASDLITAVRGTPATTDGVAERQSRLSDLFETASGEDPRASARAIDELKRRVQASPVDADARAALAFSYLSTGQTDAMLREAKKLSVAANSHETHFNAAQLFAAGGRRRQARRHYRAALRLARSRQDRDDALRGLAEL